MLDRKILRRLESITQLPTMPQAASEVLNSIDNYNIGAAKLAAIIEKDQALTAKVLTVANSPFFGFERRISTIELAVVILGSNTLKEIILSLIISNFFKKIRRDIFDVEGFWRYSLYCASSSRVLARRLGYRVAGEAFVAGLMHDIGTLIIVQYFSKQYRDIIEYRNKKECSLHEAEMYVMEASHAEIGAWLASKWNLPDRLHDSILYHHCTYPEYKILAEESKSEAKASENPEDEVSEDYDLLAAIVAMSEWFASETGFMAWTGDKCLPHLYLANEILDELKDHEHLEPDSVIKVIKQEIIEELEKASVLKMV